MRLVGSALLSIGMLLSACGTEAPPIVGVEPIFPVALGNRWTFKVTSSKGNITQKVQTVTGTVSTDTGAAFVFRTEREANLTISHQRASDDGKLVRVYEQGDEEDISVMGRVRFVPPQLRIDGMRTSAGANYESSHVEEHLSATDQVVSRVPKTQRFLVEAVDDEITVPAGVFKTVRVRRETVGGSSKTYWYAFGVGKVKEVGGQTEELSSYSLKDTP
jgi:hypothetical protein